jgi:radical SAM superfamily enzyme YgiQ (UPF0313 family)
MNITLVIPEDIHSYRPTVYPPLGLLYVASELRDDGHDVSIFDLRDSKVEEISKCDVIACTATTSQSDRVKELSGIFRKKSDFTMIGGAYASWTPEDIQDYFDCVIVGESEGVVSQAVREMHKGIIRNPILKDVDKIKFPARDMLPRNRIVSKDLWGGYGFDTDIEATTIITSRGCPWKCAFCANIPQKIRYRSPENVVDELKHIVSAYECNHFRFLDDNFIMNKKRLVKMCELIAPMGIKFRCSGRSDLITDEICELLKEMGCGEIGLGVESADNNVLKIIRKSETVEDHERAIETIRRHGMKSKVFFMSGLPGETYETIEMNKKFIERTKPDKWFCTLFTPYPGCDIWENPSDYGVEIINKNFSNYYQTYPTRSTINTDVACSDELNDHHKKFMDFMEKQKK